MRCFGVFEFAKERAKLPPCVVGVIYAGPEPPLNAWDHTSLWICKGLGGLGVCLFEGLQTRQPQMGQRLRLIRHACWQPRGCRLVVSICFGPDFLREQHTRTQQR